MVITQTKTTILTFRVSPLHAHRSKPNQRCAIKCMLKVYFGHGLQVEGVELEFWVTYIWVGANKTIII